MWWKKLPDTSAFHAFIRSFPYDFSLWDGIARQMEGGDDWKHEGYVLLRDEAELIKMMCKEARTGFVNGHSAAFVNTTCHWSEVGHYLLNMFDTDIALSYYIDKNNKAKLSLRSKRIDVSEVAKTFGGGGHKAAAGAVVELDVLLNLLKG
jgi:nanoRNase/pAp phosphatase (c-di-AMP/oligoRNAs hydrolase)